MWTPNEKLMCVCWCAEVTLLENSGQAGVPGSKLFPSSEKVMASSNEERYADVDAAGRRTDNTERMVHIEMAFKLKMFSL